MDASWKQTQEKALVQDMWCTTTPPFPFLLPTVPTTMPGEENARVARQGQPMCVLLCCCAQPSFTTTSVCSTFPWCPLLWCDDEICSRIFACPVTFVVLFDCPTPSLWCDLRQQPLNVMLDYFIRCLFFLTLCACVCVYLSGTRIYSPCFLPRSFRLLVLLFFALYACCFSCCFIHISPYVPSFPKVVFTLKKVFLKTGCF